MFNCLSCSTAGQPAARWCIGSPLCAPSAPGAPWRKPVADWLRLRCHQPDDPNWMKTLMAWVAAQAVWPGGSRQTVSLVPWTARASHPPVRPGASVAVPGGGAGSGRHELAGPVMVAAWFPLVTTATVRLGPAEADMSLVPCSGNGGDRTQWAPLPVDQAASRRAAGPVPAASSAMVVPDVVVSRSTV